MKKKYFTPEMEEMDVEDLVLLVGSCASDEKEVTPCTSDDGIAPPCDEDGEV